MAFRRAGQALGDAADVDLPALSAALDAALAGVQQLGAAREGDKTMVDALAPATRAFSKAIAEGASPDDALSVLAEAAAAGAVATVSMQALKGRASYLGPRSVGHEDPGAVSTALILGALARRRAGRAMTAPSRYRGQPVSEGIGTGEIYLGDAPGFLVGTAPVRPDPDEDDVRAAFAAVARERAALAARLRERGQDLQAGIVDIGALIAADPALTGPAIDAVRAGADGIAAVTAAAEAQAAVLAALPDPDLAQRARRRPPGGRGRGRSPARDQRGPAPRGNVHPGPPRGRPGRPHPAGRQAGAWPGRGVGRRAGPARTRRSSPAVSACPCWSAPTRRCWPRRPGTTRSSTPPRAS